MAKAKKLPSGSWRVQAKANGQVKSFTGSDRKTVEAEAKAWQAGITADVENMTVGKAYERYICSKENVLSPTTIRAYKGMARTNFQELMSLRIDKLSNEIIQAAVNRLSCAATPKSVRNNYGLLTAVIAMFNPYFKPVVKLPQRDKKEIVIPTKKQVQLLIKSVSGTQYYIPVLLAALCGMRAGEICALESKDVNGNKINVNKSLVRQLDGRWVTKPPKSYSGYRVIDAPPIVEEALKEKSGKIVSMTSHSLSDGFSIVLKRAGLPHFRFHDLRHFYVSELFDMGLPEKYIIAQVGHSSASITKSVYDHLAAEKQTKYAEDVASHFSDF